MKCLLITNCSTDSTDVAVYLSSRNINLEVVRNPLQGIQKAHAANYNIIIYELAKGIGNDDQMIKMLQEFNPNARIIVCAGRNSRQLESMIRKHKIYFYHLDAFGSDDLKLALNSALNMSNAKEEQQHDYGTSTTKI